MPRLRPSLIALAVAGGLLAAVAIVLFGVVRLSWFERQAEQRMSAALGWPVRVDGLSIAYYPSPRVEVRDVLLPPATRDDAPPLLELGQVSVTLPWRTVAGLGGHVTRVELRAPRLYLERRGDEAGNWEGLLEQVASLGGEGPSTLSIGELQVTEGRLDYVGAAGDRSRLAGIQLTAREVGLGTPFDLALRCGGDGLGRTFHLSLAGRALLDPDRAVYAADELTLDGWVGGGDLPLAGVEGSAAVESLHADLAAGRTTVRGLKASTMGMEVAGNVEWDMQETAQAVTFAIGTGPFSPRAVGVALGRPLPDTEDPAALTRAVLQTAGEWNTGGLALSRLEGELDDSRFSGDARIPAGESPPELHLSLDRLDLDRYLPPDAPAEQDSGSLAAVVEGLRDSLQALDLDAEVTIGEARASGVIARQLTIRLEPMSPKAPR